MKLRTLYLLPLPLLSLPLLLLFNNFLRHPHNFLPDCPHILIITEARHGSTWFLDSTEHCRYSKLEQVESGIYGKQVYRDTELWHIHNSSLRNMRIPAVLSRLHNTSLKLFPTGFDNLRRIHRLLRVIDSPVVVLRRAPLDACCSLREAFHSGLWAKIKAQNSEVEDVACKCDRKCQDQCRDGIRNIENYFADVARVLHNSGVQADWIWYEHVKDLPVVTLRNARCVVRNCNFAAS